MLTTKVSDKYRITLPHIAREKLHISIGDPLEVVIRNDSVVLKPKKLIDTSQSYFWTKEWQEKERQVEADFDAGRFESTQSLEEFFHKIHRRK